jgi:hypothetical protein
VLNRARSALPGLLLVKSRPRSTSSGNTLLQGGEGMCVWGGGGGAGGCISDGLGERCDPSACVQHKGAGCGPWGEQHMP